MSYRILVSTLKLLSNNLTVALREKWQTLEIEKKWKKFPRNFFIIWLHFCYCFGINFNIQLKILVVSQNLMVLYTILFSSSLIYIYVNSCINITSSVVSGYEYLTLTWAAPGSIPLQAKTFFTFFFFFLDLAKFSTKLKVEIRDTTTFFKWILKFWPQWF